MARRLAKKIGRDIEQLRWLWWQTVRRCPQYQRDVEDLLSCWRCSKSAQTRARQSSVVRLNSGRYVLRPTFFVGQARTRATAAALEGYERLCTRNWPDLPPNPRAKRRRRKYFLAAVELASIVDRALHSRYYTLPERPTRPLPIIALLTLKRRKEDGLPELKTFSRRWALRFPIPSSVRLPPEELMTCPWCRPVRILRGSRHSLTMILYPAVGREIILALIDGALHHFNPKRKRGEAMRWRMASRKRGIKGDLEVVSLSKNRLKVTIALPAHAQDVRKAVADNLPRSAASWRSREDYENVFRTVDSLKTQETKRQACSEETRDRNGLTTDSFKVRDYKRAFNSLVRKFSLPR